MTEGGGGGSSEKTTSTVLRCTCVQRRERRPPSEPFRRIGEVLAVQTPLSSSVPRLVVEGSVLVGPSIW